MITVTFNGESYECTKAIKGDDYIHLLNNGVMVASFDGVMDSSGFNISGGEWTEPTAEVDCYLAIIRDDGTIGYSSRRCCDINKMYHHTILIRDYANNFFRLSIYNYLDSEINDYSVLRARIPDEGVPAFGRFTDSNLNNHDVMWFDGSFITCRDYSTLELEPRDIFSITDTVTEIS